jgi:hypothetical protein
MIVAHRSGGKEIRARVHSHAAPTQAECQISSLLPTGAKQTAPSELKEIRRAVTHFRLAHP